ncbi:MAG TPA: DUF1150 family protein [Paracoccus sp. (in: a-proteobacteria)]|nr:DUF1150 family protein [Paracoccus sp. (in: a-proteobacteria)]
MNMKHEFPDIVDGNTVYIRQVSMDALPAEVRAQAPGLESLYAVHGIDGERLALVRDRQMAFLLARQNELNPVSVH